MRELPSGQPILEVQMAERLGISRTPVREALQRLESEGLLKKLQIAYRNQEYLIFRCNF